MSSPTVAASAAAAALFSVNIFLVIILAASAHCPSSGETATEADWTEFNGSCYAWFNATDAWFPAEATCRSLGGHLASVGSDRENRLVGRLSGCRDTWIGRFSSDFHRTADPVGYEWTDGSGVGDGVAMYSRHDFTQTDEPHKGAIRAAGLAWYNSHYHDRYPFMCEVTATQEAATGDSCPQPFVQFRSHCYWLSDFEASFVEASLYCERDLHCHMASVLNEDELKFLGILDLDADTCELGTIWVGLIKQNPCRPVGDNSPQLCFQWTDLSGQHLGFPRWQRGHPLTEDWTVNCVTLTGDALSSEKCHTRRRFVCKLRRFGAPAPTATADSAIGSQQ